jgi:hypothetical protein
MKKLLGCILGLMLMFGLSGPAAADILVYDVDPPDISSYWSGSDMNGQTLPNSGDATEEAWLNALLGNDGSGDWVDLNYRPSVVPGDGEYIGGFTNSYAVLKYGNGKDGAMDIYGFSHWAIQDDGDGILELYGVVNPYNSIAGHALYNAGATIDLGTKALSHVNAAVPEPASMLLLGSGLLGFGVFGRKRFKK